MRRHATVLPALLLALALASPATSQPRTSLSATTDEVSAEAGGVIGFDMLFPSGSGNNYILLMALGDRGFEFGRIHIPLTPDFLLIHTFFGDLGAPILQSGFRGTMSRDNAVAFMGFPPGFLEPFIGLTLYFAAIQFPTGLLPADSTNPIELRIVR